MTGSGSPSLEKGGSDCGTQSGEGSQTAVRDLQPGSIRSPTSPFQGEVSPLA